MRINQYIALCSGLSRRQADQAISSGRVLINDKVAVLGDRVNVNDKVKLDNEPVDKPGDTNLIMLNKPKGYVCSRSGQGSLTIYDLLPKELAKLKPIGRLDKDSSGLLLLTNDGQLAYKLTHPKFSKIKVYEVSLNKPLTQSGQIKLERGVKLEDGLSKLALSPLKKDRLFFKVKLSEGRNRQIRRSFSHLGYQVVDLKRTQMGQYKLKDLSEGKYIKTIMSSISQ